MCWSLRGIAVVSMAKGFDTLGGRRLPAEAPTAKRYPSILIESSGLQFNLHTKPLSNQLTSSAAEYRERDHSAKAISCRNLDILKINDLAFSLRKHSLYRDKAKWICLCGKNKGITLWVLEDALITVSWLVRAASEILTTLPICSLRRRPGSYGFFARYNNIRLAGFIIKLPSESTAYLWAGKKFNIEVSWKRFSFITTTLLLFYIRQGEILLLFQYK